MNTSGAAPTEAGYFISLGAVASCSGGQADVAFQPLATGSTMLSFVSFDENGVAPVHQHSEEQIVLVLKGEMVFQLDGEERVMREGDIAVVPPWVRHGAFTRNMTCLEVDIFNPPRQALLDPARGR